MKSGKCSFGKCSFWNEPFFEVPRTSPNNPKLRTQPQTDEMEQVLRTPRPVGLQPRPRASWSRFRQAGEFGTARPKGMPASDLPALAALMSVPGDGPVGPP